MSDHAKEVHTGRNTEEVNPVTKRVNDVIDDLSARKVQDNDRTNLRKALDVADTPDTGRAAQNRALGNLSGNRSKAT